MKPKISRVYAPPKQKEVDWTGKLMPGWSLTDWRARLEQMAEACEGMHPDRARELREWASKLGEQS